MIFLSVVTVYLKTTGWYELFMVFDPFKYIVLTHAAIGHAKTKCNDIFVIRIDMDPIEFQKNKHHINA